MDAAHGDQGHGHGHDHRPHFDCLGPARCRDWHRPHRCRYGCPAAPLVAVGRGVDAQPKAAAAKRRKAAPADDASTNSRKSPPLKRVKVALVPKASSTRPKRSATKDVDYKEKGVDEF